MESAEADHHTYMYEPDRELHQMTLEALPAEENYQPLDKVFAGHSSRPTLEELVEGQKAVPAVTPEVDPEAEAIKAGKVIKFGWVEGVLMRCLLNIWGTMLFLRLTWVIGQAGIWQGLLVITLCNVVTALSAISMSAVATNGQIAGGSRKELD